MNFYQTLIIIPLFTLLLFVSSSSFAQDTDEGKDCCGPDDSSCCPGQLITGGIMGIAVEVAEDVAAENTKPAEVPLSEEWLGKALYSLMKKLGFGDHLESSSTTSSSKPNFSAIKIKAIHAMLSKLKKGSKVTGRSAIGGRFKLIVKKAKNKPFFRRFTYKPSTKSNTLLVDYKTTPQGISFTWKDTKSKQ
jgi:hypothetical protein